MDVRIGNRTLHAYDSGTGPFPVFWHHGSPQLGTPPEPLLSRARWLSLDRPGYGGSARRSGRSVADIAADTAAVADAAGVDRFAVLGASGGGPHALACAALLPDRVVAVATVAGIAPYDADGLDYFAGMADTAEFRAAEEGPDRLRDHLARAGDPDPAVFVPADLTALGGPYGRWLIESTRDAGLDGYVDDDLALVRPWGFRVEDLSVPALLVHGERDRMVPVEHSRWLAGHCAQAELWLRPEDGHLSIFGALADALDWLRVRSQ